MERWRMKPGDLIRFKVPCRWSASGNGRIENLPHGYVIFRRPPSHLFLPGDIVLLLSVEFDQQTLMHQATILHESTVYAQRFYEWPPEETFRDAQSVFEKMNKL